jgi:hypothetical protein
VWVLGLPMWVCSSGSSSVAVGIGSLVWVSGNGSPVMGPSWLFVWFVAVGLVSAGVGHGSADVGLWQWVSVCGRGYWVSGAGLW